MIRVWVTRDEPPGGPLGAALREADLEPIHEPAIERIKCGDAHDELALLGSDDWLALTSAFTVTCLASDAISAATPPRIIAVGEATAEAARGSGLRVDEVLDGGAEELFARLRRSVTRGIICYPRSTLAQPPEPWGDVTVIAPVVYETKPRAFDRSITDRVDIAAVTSPSAVRAIGRINLPLASIGRSTTQAIRKLGMTPLTEAQTSSFTALARAIAALKGDLR